MEAGNKMAMAGEVTGLGLIVVFACLVLIIVLVVVLSAILKERPKKKKKGSDIIEKTIESAVVAAPAAPAMQNDGELVAVLTAAVYAALGEQAQAAYPGGLVVRSYRRVNYAPAWERAGKNEQIYNKF